MNQTETASLFDSYTPSSASNDEMLTASGHFDTHWQDFIAYLDQQGPAGIERLQWDVRRLLQENGVTYNVYGSSDGHQRPWPLDIIPFILAEEDWRVIESGVIQRAELLNLILTDLYGPQRLLKEGLLPLELIYQDPGFLRPCHGIELPSNHQLITYAADLARGPDKRMWVVGDRTQAPSGAGYALENRTIMSEVQRALFRDGPFRDGKIRRLSGYFRDFQVTMSRLAAHGEPQRGHAPRVVVMTPGPHNETYFEHAYLAAYLGYTLVQGDDLSIFNGEVSLKALSGLQPVDAILRRVDDTFCDPLELRSDSHLGVAGLIESVRRGQAVVINPLGSGVLENPALLPFLPGIAQAWLGEELILPMAATWWCGQPKEMAYVLEHLDELIIKPTSGYFRDPVMVGSQLSQAERKALAERIRNQPHRYVGQQQVSYSTAPALSDGRPVPRHTILRSYALARQDDYTVMPGGLTLSAAAPNEFVVSTSAGGISKDTWVLTSEPQHHISLWELQSDETVEAFHRTESLPSRAAENLYWVGRYAERAESTARLLRTIFEFSSGEALLSEPMENAVRRQLLFALTHTTMTYPGFVDEENVDLLHQPTAELLSVALDPKRLGGLHADLSAMVGSAYAARNLWSSDSWRVMQEIDGLWNSLADKYSVEPADELDLNPLRRELNRGITQLLALAGLNAESMTHNAGWLMLDIGRRLERALRTTSFIRSMLVFQQEPLVEQSLLEATLKTTDNIITYRRRYRSHLQLQTVLDLLLLDELSPRSLIWQLNTLRAHLAELPRRKVSYRLSKDEQLLMRATTQLQLANTERLVQPDGEDEYLRESLDTLLADLTFHLSGLSSEITQTYLTHSQVLQQFGGSRAALNG